MDTIVVAAISVGLALLAALIATVVWLSKARKGQVEAEVESNALREGKEKKSAADKIMAEPTAFEPYWLQLARERVRERDRES